MRGNELIREEMEGRMLSKRGLGRPHIWMLGVPFANICREQ